MPIEIKICGITNSGDALKALELGADYLGFILYNRSPRYISPSELAELRMELPDDIEAVGVFVNSPREEVQEIIETCKLHAVQLHGDEDLNNYLSLPVPVWKAVRLSPETSALPHDADLAERVLLDTAVEGMYGGTGKQIDLAAAAKVARTQRVMLAGGIGPDNVAESIKTVRPVGVDVSSGVEASPGRKDHGKLEAFFAAARSV